MSDLLLFFSAFQMKLSLWITLHKDHMYGHKSCLY